MKKLEKKIIKWAKDRKIIQNSTISAQYVKLLEEACELILAIKQENQEEIIDAIGDCFVVLIIINEMSDSKYNLEEIKAIDEFVPLYILIRNAYLEEPIYIILQNLFDIAKFYLLDPYECLEIAYNEIKDRKGYLNENGLFVKEQ